jgi:DNA-binding response OmpR family regulator
MQDGKHVILCVDDDPDVVVALKTVLEANGYVVLGAGSAEEGLKVYKKNQPDLIIADLMMEEVDAGTAMVKELKLLGNTAPVIMLSSVGDDLNMEVDYSQLGLAGVFQKPVDNEHLLKVLQVKLS